MELLDDKYCFACGVENPIGLKMKFEYDGDEVRINFTPGREHQGWQDVIHGGILFTLMDEAMARVIINKGDMVVTSRLDTRFLRPAKVGDSLTIIGKIDGQEDKKFKASCVIKNGRGKTVATCKGAYVRI